MRKKILEAKNFLDEEVKNFYDIGLLIGTGLSEATPSMKIDYEFEYSKIPHFPVSTVESHSGKLLFGSIEGKNIIVMQGRVHLYEGYSPYEVTFPIRIMQEFGVKHLFLSNASGGINLNFSVGDIMVVNDHINLTGKNPLIGYNEKNWGIRFIDMTQVYDKDLIVLAHKIGKKENIKLLDGVYAGLTGPSLETPAETRYLKIAGSDAVGFSTVMEAIAGVHAGMKIFGLAAITNINNPDDPQKATIEEIIENAQKTSIKVNTLFKGIIKNI